ncbi:hypothetical protein AACH10_18660 [Ideonella sp. DXS22W]|uniref:Lipoprotein n=1 Tax=Pseudaquabacterium inlustre TaxID=2984192 RepID=A0ABU9CM87_9BURK
MPRLRHTPAARAPALRRGALACSLLTLAACGQVQVRTLATGEVERPAYALGGGSMAQLRDEAQRLCPNGAEVLRQSQRIDGARGSPPAESWYGRWWQATQTTVAPPRHDAQLLVLCQATPGSGQLARLPEPVPPAAAASQSAAQGLAAHGQPKASGSAAPVGEGELRDGLTAALSRAAVRSAAEPAPGPAPQPVSARKPMRASSAPVLTY